MLKFFAREKKYNSRVLSYCHQNIELNCKVKFKILGSFYTKGLSNIIQLGSIYWEGRWVGLNVLNTLVS